MPKSKKQKTIHNTGANGELSQAEIWDDSALIRSWNDAVAEYEYYHSIHARGEDVEEVLRQAELAELASSGKSAFVNERLNHPAGADGKSDLDHAASEEGEVDEEEDDDVGNVQVVGEGSTIPVSVVATSGLSDRMTEKAQPQPVSDELSYQQVQQPAQPKDLPQPASSSDQTLENIKMAYYWAGYYSGLYDGQKQVEAQAHAKNSKR